MSISACLPALPLPLFAGRGCDRRESPFWEEGAELLTLRSRATPPQPSPASRGGSVISASLLRTPQVSKGEIRC